MSVTLRECVPPDETWFCQKCTTVLQMSGECPVGKAKKTKTATSEASTLKKSSKKRPEPPSDKEAPSKANSPKKKRVSEDKGLLARIEAEIPKVIEAHKGGAEELTGRVVRKRLEKVLGMDLSEQKKMILKLTKQIFDQMSAESK